MGALEYRWGKFRFKKSGMRTDLNLYRDRAYLTLPSDREENRFLIDSEKDRVDFYAGSTSDEDFRAFEAFFTTQYDLYTTSESVPPIEADGVVTLLNRAFSRKRGFSYFPSFLRNIILLPSSLPRLRLQYEVIIRSSRSLRKRKRYNFCTIIRYRYDTKTSDRVRDYVVNEVLRLRDDGKWSAAASFGNRVRFRTDLLDDPFMLCNFVRVPEDEGGSVIS